MDTNSREFKMTVRLTVCGCVLGGAYVTGFLLNVLDAARYRNKISLGSSLLALFTNAKSLILVPVFSAAFLGLAAYFVDKKWKENSRNDGMGRDFRHSKDASPYGDARFLQPHEYHDVAQIRPIENCKGKLLGQLSSDGSECIDFNPTDPTINNHMMVIGMSGCGKTYTFVKPYIFQSVKAGHSLIVTDPDGGLFEDMSGYLRDNGYVVRTLNLKSLRKSDGWDVLKTLQGENLGTNVQIFARTVISNISTENNIYSSGANSLLCALVLKVLLGHEYTEKTRNIRSVYELLQHSEGLGYLERVFDPMMMTSEEERACLAPYSAFKQASANLSANIATHLANGLQLLQDQLLCDVLSTDDIDLTLPGQRPCAYFAQFPDSHQTYRFVVSLFFSLLFMNLVDYADLRTKERKLEVPVDFLLDEFPSIGIIPDWDSKMAVVRKRGINCVMIIQDLPQLRTRYKETWPTIIDNCGTIVTLGVNEPNETAQYLSKLIGQASIEVQSTSETQNREQSRSKMLTNTSVSTGVGKRDLLSPAEICKITSNDSLILLAHRYPIFAHKTPYTLYEDADKLYVTKPDSVIDFQNKAARELLREAEKKYIDSFWKTHKMHPNLHPEDNSDALYTVEAASPIKAAWQVIKSDFRQMRYFFARKAENANKDTSIVLEKEHSQTAEKGAFQKFYEDYCRVCGRYVSKTPENQEKETKTASLLGDTVADAYLMEMLKKENQSQQRQYTEPKTIRPETDTAVTEMLDRVENPQQKRGKTRQQYSPEKMTREQAYTRPDIPEEFLMKRNQR